MPAVLIVGPVEQSLAGLDGDLVVRKVSSVDDFRRVYEEFASLRTSRVLVLHDVAALRGTARLAKFLEETGNRVVCLSSEDCLDEMTESRFSRVVKTPTLEKFSGHDDAEALAAALDSEDVSPEVAALRHFPRALPDVSSASRSRFRKKLLALAAARRAAT